MRTVARSPLASTTLRATKGSRLLVYRERYQGLLLTRSELGGWPQENASTAARHAWRSNVIVAVGTNHEFGLGKLDCNVSQMSSK